MVYMHFCICTLMKVPTAKTAIFTSATQNFAIPSFHLLDAYAMPVLHSRHVETQRKHHAYADARPSWRQMLMAAPGNWQQFR